MKLALIGCGAIGSIIAKAIDDGTVQASLECVFDTDRESAKRLIGGLKKKPEIARDVEEILDRDIDLVIEAASPTAAKSVAVRILNAGKSMMIMSVGAFADEKFFNQVKDAAKGKSKVYLPSGAIGALDALKAASIANLDEVSLITTKNPKSLKGAPFFEETGINAEAIKEKTVLFEGYATDAVQKFPANVNVAVALGLAGTGSEKTKVTIVADPKVDRNIHEIYARGDFGELRLVVENLPSPQNPKTSYLAALSAIALLKRIVSQVEIGT
jgi:aspartate dehydrogenase